MTGHGHLGTLDSGHMNDRAAAAIIKELVPDIRREGPAALVKYAREHDFPAAFLEKMGQVANRLITLHHVETAEDRGSGVAIIDVPRMLASYDEPEPVKRAAAAVVTHDHRTVDFTRMLVAAAGVRTIVKQAATPDPLDLVLRFAGLVAQLQVAHWDANTTTEEHETLGELYAALSAGADRYAEAAMGHAGTRKMEPAEVDLSAPHDAMTLVREILVCVKDMQMAAKKVEAESLLNIAAELEEAINSTIYKLTNKTEKAATWTDSEIEAAALELYAESRLGLAKAASAVCALLEADGVIASVAFAEREALAEGFAPDRVKSAFDWLCESTPTAARASRLENYSGIRVRSMSAGTRLTRALSEMIGAHTTTLVAKAAADVADADPGEVETVERPAGPIEDNAPGEETEVQDRGTAADVMPGADGATPEQPTDPTTEEASRRKSKDDKEKGGDKGAPAGTALRDLAGLAASPLAAAADSVSTAANMANTALTNITGKDRVNTAQRRTDMSTSDIVRTIMVRRMLATDPILREADPRAVLEVYNAIAKLHPDVANDPQRLRLVLREAASYDGLTLDSQKQLADTRKSEEDASAKARENSRSQYSVGGSDLPTLLNIPSAK